MELATRDALRLLSSIEEGDLEISEIYKIAERCDPVLVYFVIRYLREKYPSNHPSAQGVIERIVQLSSNYDKVVKMTRQGEKDPMREWFDDSYSMREFFSRPEEFIDMIVDKLES